MKILLDESLPIQLAFVFGSQNEVFTVRDMNWLGKKNGELMKLIVANKFEVFVTADRNLVYQQNVSAYNVIIAVLCGKNNRITTYKSLIPKLLDFLSKEIKSQIIEVS